MNARVESAKGRLSLPGEVLRRTAVAAVVLMSVSAAAFHPCGAAEFFVAPHGNDAQAGTREKPFTTLEAARDAVRRSDRSNEETIVWLRAGTYERSAPFVLTADDSGRPGKAVTYRAWPGEEVRLVGGRQVDRWQPVTDDAVLRRLAAEAETAAGG